MGKSFSKDKSVLKTVLKERVRQSMKKKSKEDLENGPFRQRRWKKKKTQGGIDWEKRVMEETLSGVKTLVEKMVHANVGFPPPNRLPRGGNRTGG